MNDKLGIYVYISLSKQYPSDKKLLEKLGLEKLLTIFGGGKIEKRGIAVCQQIFPYQLSIECFSLLMKLLNRKLSKS